MQKENSSLFISRGAAVFKGSPDGHVFSSMDAPRSGASLHLCHGRTRPLEKPASAAPWLLHSTELRDAAGDRDTPPCQSHGCMGAQGCATLPQTARGKQPAQKPTAECSHSSDTWWKSVVSPSESPEGAKELADPRKGVLVPAPGRDSRQPLTQAPQGTALPKEGQSKA